MMWRMVRLLSTLACATLLVLSPAAALGQTSSNEQMARSIFEAGRTAYDSGRFDQALRYFQEAYDMSPRPVLLFNIGSAADRLQENQRALDAYRAYLEAVPSANNRELVESRIQFLEGVLERGGDATPRVATPAEAAQSVGSTPADQPAPRGGDVTSEWWFWTLIAVVVIGAGVGITAGAVAASSGVDSPAEGSVPPVTALVEF
jgi:tetratricopeptide (TPR) repeat protein